MILATTGVPLEVTSQIGKSIRASDKVYQYALEPEHPVTFPLSEVALC